MILLDSGNFTGAPTVKGEIQTRGLLEGMARMGYKVSNVGERDIRSGYDSFAKLTGDSELQFISANVLRKDNQAPVFAPHAVVEADSTDGTRKLRIGVIGVTRYNPVFLKPGPDGSEMIIAAPAARVQQELAALQEKKVDLVVLLAALQQDDARLIVRENPGIDFVVGSYGGFVTNRREQEGRTWILYSGNQGKRFGSTRVFLGENGEVSDQSTRMHFLTSVYPSHQPTLDFVNAVNAKVPATEKNRTDFVAKRTGAFLGSEACKSCHVEAFEQWKGTSHATAFETLRAEKQARNEECLACHTTGPGRGGFGSVQVTPHLAEVGCESCHGAGRNHVARPGPGYGGVPVVVCTACHDEKNSPEFDNFTYRSRVRHGDSDSY